VLAFLLIVSSYCAPVSTESIRTLWLSTSGKTKFFCNVFTLIQAWTIHVFSSSVQKFIRGLLEFRDTEICQAS